jgi:hypothetical protein
MKKINKQLKSGIAVYFMVIILGIIYALLAHFYKCDFMETTTVIKSHLLGNLFCENGNYCLWPVSHFIMYLMLGYIAPNYWWLWLLTGISWELLEAIIGRIIQNIYNKGLNNDSVVLKDNNNLQYTSKWMCGMKSDILFNSMGLLIGLTIAKIANNTTIPQKSYTITYTV